MVERFIQSVKQECLDHFVVFGRDHFNYLCREYSEHYFLDRPHQSKDNACLTSPKTSPKKAAKPMADSSTIRISDVRCKERLGGLLKHYTRAA